MIRYIIRILRRKLRKPKRYNVLKLDIDMLSNPGTEVKTREDAIRILNECMRKLIDVQERFDFVFRHLGLAVRPKRVRAWTTTKGVHFEIRLDRKLEPAVIIALQLLLGSDWHRETFNLKRVLIKKFESWNMLFEVKAYLHIYRDKVRVEIVREHRQPAPILAAFLVSPRFELLDLAQPE